jgi:hypothetical protein
MPGQRVTHQLVDFGEGMLGRLRLILRLPWAGNALLQLASILRSIFDGSADSAPTA